MPETRELVEVKVNSKNTGILKEYGAAAGIVTVIKTVGFNEDTKADPIEIITFGDGKDLLDMFLALEQVIAPTLGINPIALKGGSRPYGSTVTSLLRNNNKNSNYSILKRIIKYLDKHIS